MQDKTEGRKSYIIRDKTEGRKFDAGKLRYDLLPPDAMRHLEAYRSGEEVDPETGKQHLAHAICCMIFLLEGGGGNPSVT